MFRAALFVLLLAASPSLAAGPGERVDLRSGSLLGFALVAEIGRDTEPAAAGPLVEERTMVGLGFRHDGWDLTATAGTLAYAYTGAAEGQARAASFAIGHTLATREILGGGTLRLELRQTMLFEGETRLDVTEARLGWSLKF